MALNFTIAWIDLCLELIKSESVSGKELAYVASEERQQCPWWSILPYSKWFLGAL